MNKDSLLKQTVKTNSFSMGGWDFAFNSAIISKSTEIDKRSDEMKLQQCPEQVYGANTAIISKQDSNFKLIVEPWESLSFCNYEKSQAHSHNEPYSECKDFMAVNFVPHEIKVKHTEIWKQKKLNEIPDVKELEKISCPFFCTCYKGTIIPSEKSYLQSTDEEIPLGNLTPQNPIQWHDQILLWEDEIGDNGNSSMDFRLRVMNDCYFGLIRHYLRVDDVAIRMADTRIYHEFSKDYILREHTVKEDSYLEIAKKGFKFTTEWMSNPNQSFIISDFLTTKFSFKDKIYI